MKHGSAFYTHIALAHLICLLAEVALTLMQLLILYHICVHVVHLSFLGAKNSCISNYNHCILKIYFSHLVLLWKLCIKRGIQNSHVFILGIRRKWIPFYTTWSLSTESARPSPSLSAPCLLLSLMWPLEFTQGTELSQKSGKQACDTSFILWCKHFVFALLTSFFSVIGFLVYRFSICACDIIINFRHSVGICVYFWWWRHGVCLSVCVRTRECVCMCTRACVQRKHNCSRTSSTYDWTLVLIQGRKKALFRIIILNASFIFVEISPRSKLKWQDYPKQNYFASCVSDH